MSKYVVQLILVTSTLNIYRQIAQTQTETERQTHTERQNIGGCRLVQLRQRQLASIIIIIIIIIIRLSAAVPVQTSESSPIRDRRSSHPTKSSKSRRIVEGRQQSGSNIGLWRV